MAASSLLAIAGFDAAMAQTPLDVTAVSPLTVLGRRGSAELPAEREFSADDIDLFGAYDIGELIGQLGPMIDGTDDRPQVLVNGKRIGSPREITGFPPDALDRVEVLPPEAGGRYGLNPDQRVVNLVLKPNYSVVQGTFDASAPTAGGRSVLAVSGGRATIDKERRAMSDARLQRETPLLAKERDLPSGFGSPERTLSAGSRSASLNVVGGGEVGAFNGSGRLSGQVSERKQTQADGLLSRQKTASSGLSAGFDGKLGDWRGRLAFDGQASLSDARRGLGGPAEGRVKGAVASVGVSGDVNRLLFSLPGGQASGNLTLNLGQTWSRTETSGRGVTASVERSDLRGDLRANVALPITRGESARPGAEPASRFGGLSADLGAGVSGGGGASVRSGLNAGLTWRPMRMVNVRTAYSFSQTPPTPDQLSGPRLETVNVQVYDFARGEAVEVIQVNGGNPELEPGVRNNWSLGGSVGPMGPVGGLLRFDYQRSEAEGAIGQFPEFTPLIEAAFPDRVTRDASGRLVALDVRSINLESEMTETVTAGLTFSLPPRPRAQPGQAAALPGPRGRTGAGARGMARNRLMVTLNQTWRLRNTLTIRQGLPEFDRLAGDGGAQPSMETGLAVQGRYGLVNVTVGARWRSEARSRRTAGTDGPDDLIIAPIALIDVRTAVNLRNGILASDEEAFAMTRPGERGSNALRISLDITNLLDERPAARLGDGRPAPGYGRDERDPLGRTVKLTVSRRF
jgi:hypothetical protein